MAAIPVIGGSTNVIPADSSIFDMLTSLQTSNPQAYLAIVRPNSPPPGIGGYLFDIPGDEEVRLKSNIIRHYVEANIAVQDHISLDPETVTLRGLVAEVVSPAAAQPTQLPNQNTLPILSVMQPPATPGQMEQAAAASTTQDQQTASLADQQSFYQYFLARTPNARSLLRQNSAFLFFQQAWWGRQIMSVESPFGIWTNMAIAEVRAVQGKNSRYISDFTVIFERIRTVGQVTILPGQLGGRNVQQQAPTTQNGNAGLTAITPPQTQSVYNFSGN